eukprot:1161685-Pelagomonas_calceolata.AAC.4
MPAARRHGSPSCGHASCSSSRYGVVGAWVIRKADASKMLMVFTVSGVAGVGYQSFSTASDRSDLCTRHVSHVRAFSRGVLAELMDAAESTYEIHRSFFCKSTAEVDGHLPPPPPLFARSYSHNISPHFSLGTSTLHAMPVCDTFALDHPLLNPKHRPALRPC